MTFGSCIGYTYRASWLFVRRAWWLVLGIAAWHLLMTLGPSGEWWPVSSALMPGEPAFGVATGTLLNVFIFFVFMRFIGFRTDLARVFSIDSASLLNFLPFALALIAMSLARWIVLDRVGPLPAWAVVFLLELPLMFLLAPWAVAAPSGSGGIGPRLSVKHALPQLLWGFPFMLVVYLPVDLVWGLIEGVIAALLPAGSHGPAAVTALGDVALMVIEPAAVLAAATKMGVRVSDPERVERIFE